MIKDSAYWINKLGLKEHPEGGYYRETYRSNDVIQQDHLSGNFTGDRNLTTAIYFLLDQRDFSAFHRLKADEIWHYYAGASLVLYVIYPEGNMENIHLGPDPEAGEQPQVLVKHNTWFAAGLKDKTAYGLFGCTTSPAFDYEDFEMGNRETLLQQYPQHEELIKRLTR